MSNLLIHATNVTGLGATQVVASMLKGFQNVVDESYDKVEVMLSARGNLKDVAFSDPRFVKTLRKRVLPNSASRLLECMTAPDSAKKADAIIVLGDIPLRVNKPQVVFVQQANLAVPEVDPDSYTGFRYKTLRTLFGFNARFAKGIIVQTPLMRDVMERSYPSIKGRVRSIFQPAPIWFDLESVRSRHDVRTHGAPLGLFYPAAYNPHKNFEIIGAASREALWRQNVARVTLTIRKDECPGIDDSPLVEWRGRLGPDACMECYAKADALFFPSRSESYGLPLVEAMLANLPIVAADLPYAHALCGDQAVYFRHDSPQSAAQAVAVLREKLDAGWKPDWSGFLSRLPASWDDVCRSFMQML